MGGLMEHNQIATLTKLRGPFTFLIDLLAVIVESRNFAPKKQVKCLHFNPIIGLSVGMCKRFINFN